MEKIKSIVLNNKKYIFIVILIIFLLFIIIYHELNRNIELNDILKANDYNFVEKVEAGTKHAEFNFIYARNMYKYYKGSIVLLLYEYESLDEIKEKILKKYEEAKNNNSDNIVFENEEKYIYLSYCDKNFCNYSIGYNSNLVTSIPFLEEKKDADKVYKEIKEEILKEIG